MLAGPEGERLWAYWRDQLAGPLPTLALPTDRPRPAVQSPKEPRGRSISTGALIQRLTRLGREHGTSLYVTLLAAFQALLARQCGQDDLIVGSPVAGRDHQGQTEVVGHFVNPLPLRADLSGNPTFAELLGRTRRTVHDGLEHQDYPFTLLVERLQPARDPSRSPLFQVLFTFQKAQRLDKEGLTPFALREHGPRLDLGGFPLESVALEQRTAQFDLAMTTAETERGLAASLEYNTDLFDRETDRPHAAAVPDPPARDRRRPRDSPGRPAAPHRRRTPARPRRVERHRRRARPTCRSSTACSRPTRRSTPDATAVIDADGRSLTYAELEARANRLAHHLVAQGSAPDSLVGLCIDGSPEMIVGILGILKAGAAYLPLDPEYPRDRLASMLDDARVSLILTVERLRSVLPGDGSRPASSGSTPMLRRRSPGNPTDSPIVALDPDNLAYVIYTSGSTGRPKGVPVSHRNLVHSTWSRLLHYRQPVARLPRCSPRSPSTARWPGSSGPLSQGGRLVLARRGIAGRPGRRLPSSCGGIKPPTCSASPRS